MLINYNNLIMKKITFWIFALFACLQIQAQVSLYSFSQSSGTYTEITGGTVLGTATTTTSFDSQNWTIPTSSIPFNFNYNGVDYTGCTVNGNGFITFGTTAPTASSGSPISATTAYAGAISAWGGDLCGVFIAGLITSETRWEVLGTAPNREFVIQFKNWRPTYSSSATEVPFMNFQIRLAETTNQIKIVYGSNGYAIGSAAASGTRQIGLRGAAATDFKTRLNTTTQLFTASTAGTANTSSQAYNTSVATPGMPTNGLVYTYSPPVPCSGTPVAGTVSPAVQNLCANTTPAALTLVGNSEGFTGLTFQWETSTDNVTWANATGVSATTMVYSPPSFVGPGIVYYRCKITCTGSTLFSFSNVVTINPAAAPVGQATGLNFTNISYTGFTANWTNSDGNRRVVYISTSPIVDPVDGPGAAYTPAAAYAGTGQQIVFDGTGATVTVSGLLPNTQYFVKVIQYLRCGSAAPFDYYFNATTGTNANTVTTTAPTALPWAEEFATTTLPINWVNTSFTVGSLAALNPSLATNYVYRNAYSFSTTGNLVTPIFVPLPANHRFVFNYKANDFSAPNNTTAAGSGNIIVAISTNNGTSYTDVATTPNNGLAGWQSYALDLAAYTGQSIRIRVSFVWTTGDFYVGFDNFKIEAIPTCEAPLWSSLTSSNITANTATVSWSETPIAAANGYDFLVGTTNVAPLNTATPTGSVAAGVVSANLTALTANTTYFVWVRSNCSTSDVSSWSGPISFTTLCANVTSFVQNFDGVTSPNMPACWAKVGNPGTGTTSTTGPVASAPNVLYLFGSTTSTPTIRMQPVSNLGAGTHRLKFKMRSSSATTLPNVDFGYLTNPFDANSFVTLTSFSTSAITLVDYVYAPPAGTYSDYPAIKMNGSVYGTVYLDDFVWEAIPTCADPSALVSANVTATSVDISWDSPEIAPAVGYEYVISTTNTVPSGAGIAVSATFAQVTTGLLPTTQYFVFVRSVCSTTDFSPWAGPITFTTGCLPLATLPWTEGFESLAVGNNIFPPCWGFLNTLSNWNIETFPVANSGVNSLGRTWSTDGWAYTPSFTLTAGTSYRFSYFMRTNDAIVGYDVTTAVGSNQSAAAMTTTLGTPLVAYQGPSWNKFTFEFTPTTNGSYSFGVRVVGPNPPNGINFDDFKLELTPTCADPSTVVVANVTSSSVDISWDAPASAPALGYQYVVSTTNTPPTGAGTAVTTTFAQVTTGLLPTTQYFVFVRSVCSATETSPWTSPISFTTSCAPITILPHVEPFNTVLPSVCWLRGDNGNLTTGPATFGTNSWFEDGLGNNGTTGALKYNLFVASANDWIISPQYTIPATGWELKFDAAAANYAATTPVTNWEADDFVEVLISSSASGLTNWTTLYTYNNTNVPAPAGVPNIIDLDAYSGQTVRFAYRAVEGTADGASDIDFSFDNFEIRLTPACPQPTNVVVSSITSTGAASSWDVMSGAASGYEYVVSTSATPPTGAGTAVTSAFVALTGLTPQTTYYLYVRANCGSGSFSVWSVQTFTTQCAPVTALPWIEGFESVTTPAFPPCWSEENGDYTTSSDTFSNTAYSGSNYLRDAWFATNEFMWTPGFQLTAGTSYDFSSWIQGDGGSGWVVDYFVNSNQISTGATQLGATYNVPGTGTLAIQPYAKITRTFVPTTSGVYYFAFRVNQPNFAPNYVAFDDVELKVTPNVIPVCATGLQATPNTTCGNFANQLSWAPVTDATGYYVTIGTTSGGSDIANAVSVSTNNYSFSGTINTQYFWKVVPYSGAGSATGCTEQSFTTVASGCYCPSVPTSNDGSGITSATVGTTPFVIADVTYVANTTTAIAVEPGTNTNVQLTFATGYTYDINIWIDFNNDFDFNDAGELVKTGIACTNVNPNTVDASFLMPLTAPTGPHRMRIGTADTGQVPPAPCYSGDYGVTLDFTVDTTLGSNTFDTNSFVAYPNPVKDVLNLSYKTAISNVKVINLLGQEVVNAKANTNDVQVNMSALNAGVYIVNVTVDDTIHSIKVIKE